MGFNKVLIENNFSGGRFGDYIREIIIHTYGGPGRSLWNWFNSAAAQVSAHYASFLDGNGEQYVEEWNTAWHAGVWEVNTRSIGIEHQDNGNPGDSWRTPEQYRNTAEMCASLCLRFNFPATSGTISPHNRYVQKVCPGGLSIERIIAETNQILAPPIPDNLYKVFINGNQIGAFSGKDNAFNAWYTNINSSTIKFNGNDVTQDFTNIMNILQQQVNDLTSQVSLISGQLSDITSQLTKSKSDNENLTKQNIDLVNQLKALQDQEIKLVDENSLSVGRLIGLLIIKFLNAIGRKSKQ